MKHRCRRHKRQKCSIELGNDRSGGPGRRCSFHRGALKANGGDDGAEGFKGHADTLNGCASIEARHKRRDDIGKEVTGGSARRRVGRFNRDSFRSRRCSSIREAVLEMRLRLDIEYIGDAWAFVTPPIELRSTSSPWLLPRHAFCAAQRGPLSHGP